MKEEDRLQCIADLQEEVFMTKETESIINRHESPTKKKKLIARHNNEEQVRFYHENINIYEIYF